MSSQAWHPGKAGGHSVPRPTLFPRHLESWSSPKGAVIVLDSVLTVRLSYMFEGFSDDSFLVTVGSAQGLKIASAVRIAGWTD